MDSSAVVEPARLSERARVAGMLAGAFPSCAEEISGVVWCEEVEIVCRLLRGQGLVVGRHYIEPVATYGVAWYWDVEPVRRGVAELQAAVERADSPEEKEAAIARRDRLGWEFGRRWYREQWEGSVVRLIGREVLKPVMVGGGYTRMVFTQRAEAVFAPLRKEGV